MRRITRVSRLRGTNAGRPIQDMLPLVFCVCKNQSSLYSPPPISIARATAILLLDVCAIHDLPATLPSYAIHHTILVMAISCKGQNAGRPTRVCDSHSYLDSLCVGHLSRVNPKPTPKYEKKIYVSCVCVCVYRGLGLTRS